jgi:hypothetical protein
VPWHYPHRSLGEPDLPDGSAVRRPVVTLAVESIQQTLIAVLDSGSPVSIADASLFAVLGIDLTNDEPLYQLPLTIAGGAGALPVYEVTLGLRANELAPSVRCTTRSKRMVRHVPNNDRRHRVGRR